MKYVFVNGRVAVTIRYWEQRAAVVEGGARIDIRTVDQVEGPFHRAGAAGFTVGPIDGGGIWRADLFVVLTDGGANCFHFHPTFEHGDVGERHDDPLLAANPRAWIEATLRDLPALLDGAGFGHLITSVDLAEHARAIPLMVGAVDACMARVAEALANPPA